MIRPAEAARIHALVKAMGPLPPLPPISAARLASRLLADKKTRGGAVHFVLPEAIGKVHIVTGIAPRSVARVLERLRSGE
jgi:3-dehydroquinate synthetase